MADLFIVDFGGSGDDERARREAERSRVRARYVTQLVTDGIVDAATAERVVATIFDHRYSDGGLCLCGCHPQLSTTHKDGADCPCTWDDARRELERQDWHKWWDGPEARALGEQREAEEATIATWIAGQVGVEAKRTTSYAPEQWEGRVDGHSFYFRERHGLWSIELDLEPNGRFANRFVGVDDDGKMLIEPVECTQGEVIAEGMDTDLGATPIEHLAFIVQQVRDHLWTQSCDHSGALFFCPRCGARMSEPQ